MLVIPVLEYCSPVWNPSAVGDIIKLESVQRIFTRCLCAKMGDMTYADRLKSLGIYTLEFRRLVADLVLFYKLIHGLVHLEIPNCFTETVNSITRGHSMRVRVAHCKTEVRSNYFGIKTAKIWNALPATVVEAPSVHCFKHSLTPDLLRKFLVIPQ